MPNAAEQLQELAGREPLLQQTEAAERVGVSREYVRQITNRFGLPFAKGNKRTRLLRLYESGLHQNAIAQMLGVTRCRVFEVLKEENLPLRKHPTICEFCGQSFDSTCEGTRFCPGNCRNGQRAHDWLVRKYGNGNCFHCGIERAASFGWPCRDGQRRHFFRRRNRRGKQMT